MLERMICKSCGGVLRDISFLHDGSEWLCDYCGTEYRSDKQNKKILIETVPARYVVLEAKAAVSEDMLRCLSRESLEELVNNILGDKFKEAIMKIMKVEKNLNPDPRERTIYYRARIRLLKERLNPTYYMADNLPYMIYDGPYWEDELK